MIADYSNNISKLALEASGIHEDGNNEQTLRIFLPQHVVDNEVRLKRGSTERVLRQRLYQ